MKEIKIEKRKIYGESYEFILNLPSFKGEKGVCGIEITPYIVCITPENGLGYNDTFIYQPETGYGSFSWRYHTPYVTKKLNEFSKRFFEKYQSGKYKHLGAWKMDFIMIIVGIIITVIAAIIEFFNNSGGSGLLM